VAETTTGKTVKIRAHSPGKYPILVVELPDGGLRTAYLEAGYDLGSAKEVEEDWLKENAIGRHSFVEVSPPREMQAGSLKDYVNRELLKGDRGERRRTP
jgi:hypothetical protein